MYKSKKEAVEAIHKHFPEKHWPVLEDALIQVIGFEKAQTLKGGTRIGGTPDLPDAPDLPNALDWPIRKAGVPNEFIQKMIEEDGTHADFIKLHIETDRPYEALAQIDLSPLSKFENLPEGLPGEGRLLFFYDSAVGPWDTGKDACKIIWDQSAVEALKQTSTPQSLIDLAKKANDQETVVMDEALQEFLEEMSEHVEDDENEVCEIGSLEPTEVRYWGPEQAMQLVTHWRLPADNSLEFENNAELTAIRSEDDEDEEDEDEDGFDYYDAEWEFHEHLHGEDMSHMGHQFLGSPCPEQSDPRGYAATYYVTGQQFPKTSEAEKRKIDEVEKEMCLLLQIDNAGYQQQDYIEGTIYFIIHKDDLATQSFDETIAIYQQT